MNGKTTIKVDGSQVAGSVVGHDMNITKITNNIMMFQEPEREFIVTYKTNIKPVSYFTGRETELKELRQRIEEGRKSVLVSGMGGIGKTHICRKLFEEYQTKNSKGENRSFSHIGYIEYNGDMNSSLQECLRYKKQENPELNKEAAWKELEYLASDGKLLLFVDNVNVTVKDDPSLERLKKLPGAIVLTSRRTAFSKEFEQLRIGFLDKEQCREIYEKIRFEDSGIRVKEEEVPDLEYIIEELAAKHTITVEHLAHLARANGWSVKTLRDQLEKKGFQLEYVDDEEKLVNIQESYEILYDLSELTEAEQNILEAFSVFPYIPLEKKICNQWLLADAGVSEKENVLFRLYRKGWLQFNIEQESYALHPVFAQFIYEKCKPRLEKHHGLIEECLKRLEIPESGSALECQKYIPFAEKIIERMDMGRGEGQVVFICVLASLLEYVAEYKKAERLFQKSLYICKNVFGMNHPFTASVCNNLAYVYSKQSEYKKAEVLYQKSLQINKKVLGKENLAEATNYDNLAYVYSARGDYKKAEVFYERGLKIREKVLGEKHPDTAASYNNLAVVYESQGKYMEAERLHKNSLQIAKKALGEEHPDTAINYNNLAEVYRAQGKYMEAEKMCKKGLQIRERVLGEKHPDTAISYGNLAGVYECQGRYVEAEGLYQKSLQINESVLGGDHLTIAINYNNLAGVYKAQGKYMEAEVLYQKSLQINKKVLGEEHPDIAINYNNLAGIYRIKGKYIEAEELYKKSIQIWENILGEEYLNAAVSYNNLAEIYYRKKEYEAALDCFFKAYKALILSFGKEHLRTKNCYGNMEVIYCKYKPEGDFKRWLEEKMKG